MLCSVYHISTNEIPNDFTLIDHSRKCHISNVFSFSRGHFNSQEKPKTVLMQNFGMKNKEYYGMLWYFLEWSIALIFGVKGTIYYVAIAKVIFSHVKITCHFNMRRYQVFALKLTWYFIGVYIIVQNNYFFSL